MRKSPTNYILLAAFTLAEAVMARIPEKEEEEEVEEKEETRRFPNNEVRVQPQRFFLELGVEVRF